MNNNSGGDFGCCRSARIVSYDILKILSCYFIILIHISGGLFYSSWGTPIWEDALFQQVVTRFAVPCFIFISGALSIAVPPSHPEKTLTISKKISGIIIPLFFWQLVHLVWSAKIDHASSAEIISDIKRLPFEHIRGHFWYGYLMIWFYLFLPLFVSVVVNLSNKWLGYLCVVLLFLPSGIDFFIRVFQIEARSPLYVAYGQMGISEAGMFLWGAFCHRNRKRITNKYVPFQSVFLIVTGIIVSYYSGRYTSFRSGSPDVMMFDYLRLPSLLYGTGVFLLLVSFEIDLILYQNKLKVL